MLKKAALPKAVVQAMTVEMVARAARAAKKARAAVGAAGGVNADAAKGVNR